TTSLLWLFIVLPADQHLTPSSWMWKNFCPLTGLRSRMPRPENSSCHSAHQDIVALPSDEASMRTISWRSLKQFANTELHSRRPDPFIWGKIHMLYQSLPS